MSARHVVVDGSNIATEGRSLPSLQQLDEAVRAFLAEHPHDICTVVVDATFEHRIDASEKQMYDEALAANELLTPPAGSIGRGDKFILEIADRVDATVFSNDSFQEFHGEYEWLFDQGRLIGGKPVPGVGWVFVARTPVRGPKSRLATRAASRKKERAGSGSAVKKAKRTGPTSSGVELGPMPTPKAPPPRTAKATKAEAAEVADNPKPTTSKARSTRGRKPKESAEVPSAEETSSAPSGRRRRRGGGGGGGGAERAAAPSEPTNAPLPFIEFVAEHQVGSEVQAEVVEFSSHGAYVMVGDLRCYAPLKLLGDPTPRSAREALTRGETRTFVVHAIHAARRGIDVALPEVSGALVVAAHKTVTETPTGVDTDADQAPGEPGAQLPESEATLAPTKKAATKRSTAKKAPAKKTTAARKATGAKKAVRKAPARKTAARKSTAKKTAAKKSTAKKKAVAKKAPARKTAARKSAAKKTTARKSAAKKTTARKSAAKKTTARKSAAKKTTARKSAAKKTTARKSAAKKTTARKSAAKKTTARKSAAKKTTARKTAARKSTARKTTARKAPARKR
jgi:hypothetical protein